MKKSRSTPAIKRDSPQEAPHALVEKAKKAALNAYAPYSGFSVGAAVETVDGRVFTGTNMENASYGLTMCAEVGALQAACVAGALHTLKRIAIVGGPKRKTKQRQPMATLPCGRCRQLIAEAAQLSGCDIEVWSGDLHSSILECSTIGDLLPGAFGSNNL